MIESPVEVSYEKVEQLAEKLSAVDQRRLILHLQALSRERDLTAEEWGSLFQSTISDLAFSGDIVDRENWYEEDER